MLQITDLTYRIGGRVILDRVSLTIPDGHKVGLIGRNGAGKSTLLKLISGDLPGDGGDIVLSKRARMGVVSQEAPAGSRSLLETVLAADTERADLLAEAETTTDPHRIAEVHTRLADIEAHTAEARAAAILSGLGFDGDAQQRPCDDFSGGWRMRVALAATLFLRPDLLLLDEPTNHLDLEATIWLENYLINYPGTIILISHDRDLLNRVVKSIAHLHDGTVTLYGGNYDKFAKTRREQMELASKHYEKQIAQQKHLQSFIDRFRAKASKAKQAQSRVKMLEKMGPAIPVVEDRGISFDFPSPKELPPPLINIHDGDVGYEEGKPILRNISLRIDMDDRIALLGANGNGKSTLAKLLADRLQLMSGEKHSSNKLRIGYFAQHQTDELRGDETPYQHMASLMPDVIEHKVRAQLGRFAFEGAKGDTKVKDLSGGEKARLLFALMTLDAPHMLILDEPTNHLDIDSRDALNHALNAYEGAVIIISHDPYLIEACADRLVLVADGTVTSFDGDVAEYRQYLLDRARMERRANKNGGEDGNGNGKPAKRDRKAERQQAAEKRKVAAPIKREVEKLEKQMEKLSERKAGIEEKMADPTLYEDANAQKLADIQKELGQIENDLAMVEQKWLDKQEEYDAMVA
ncbi:MAG: ABC-F family ATP-binding cassette domain-containing protein [Thalassospira sp.]|uniref:ABC-F family ATP-binding cassette domain-containing protein n=1 Tax=Thalassospira sp. TaxID=1912094 RepID=UPI001B2F0552|nr:ABC-F family ATP-binding cassette domain-containing protein [Thalassospira sp.]MBO6579147.1 ABC-F family ATP-binding cassette domain-containing protein [Thalassospira sp.]MBO6804248.1 ABC-F family ATP-binding cassette domain-containing protein [Thalassospira sp.]MBO6818956.1 ABC-F family ATP-binding cassette domain-containing protein [Thalassospira sp.]MBO6890201.1 ABC-F family ATP-binding cassette domain-containing protein [Thalassospira sp.]